MHLVKSQGLEKKSIGLPFLVLGKVLPHILRFTLISKTTHEGTFENDA